MEIIKYNDWTMQWLCPGHSITVWFNPLTITMSMSQHLTQCLNLGMVLGRLTDRIFKFGNLQ